MTAKLDREVVNWRSKYSLCMYVVVIGFLLNLIWENAQAPLYEGYNGFFEHFWTCLVASVVDALVLLLLFILFAVFNQCLSWPLTGKLWQYLVLVLVGGILAVWFEKWALDVEHWSYTNNMPVVPVLDIGLLPFLQLLLLPSITFYLSASAAQLYFNKKQ